ncbi:hypothetical protein [Vibrio lentus]|nr:hypothetical protein [Vibrio lentus]
MKARIHKKGTISWARHNTGRMIHIDSAINGLKCNCVCVDCGESVTAKNKGKDRAHHFAHKADTICSGESAIHAAAKQILLDAAMSKSKDGLLFPEIRCLVNYMDPLGAFSEREAFKLASSQIEFSAKQEVRLGELIVDVLVESNQSQYAIEIFYRHRKSESDIDKFTLQQLNSIEIDLSDLPWDVTPEELKAKVLSDSPRYWLFSSEREALKKNLLVKLMTNAKTSRTQRFKKVYELASSWLATCHYQGSLPALNQNHHTYNLESKYLPSLKVTRVSPEILKLDGKPIIKATITINHKSNVDVFFAPMARLTECLSDTVHLVYYYSSTHDEVELENFEWKNLNLWSDKLAVHEKKKANEVSRSISSFVQYFNDLPDYLKYSNIANKLQMFPGEISHSQSKNNYHWNAPNYVWQALVLNYCLKKGDYVDCKEIADNDWLCQLLGFSQNAKAQEGRSKSVYYWFNNHLKSTNLVTHSYSLQWIVENKILLHSKGQTLNTYIS